MSSVDRSFSSFRAAGTNGRLDFNLSWAHLVIQLVDREKFGSRVPRLARVSHPGGETQLAGFTGGPLA